MAAQPPLSPAAHGYEEGVRDGKIQALERMVANHEKRFDIHEGRLRIMERMLYGLIGALALIEFMPAIGSLLK